MAQDSRYVVAPAGYRWRRPWLDAKRPDPGSANAGVGPLSRVATRARRCPGREEESRRTFSLAALYEVVQVWQARVASAPAVDAFLGSGRDETGFRHQAQEDHRRARERNLKSSASW